MYSALQILGLEVYPQLSTSRIHSPVNKNMMLASKSRIGTAELSNGGVREHANDVTAKVEK